MKDLFYYLSRRVGRAISDFGLIEGGDRILVGVSGGKDSLALLEFLLDKQKKSPVKFSLVPYHVQVFSEVAEVVERFLTEKGLSIEVDREALKDLDLNTAKKDSCFLCSWYRRKALFFAAKRHGCNKVALGHNMDDVVQTFLMNVFFQATISTMCPRQEFFSGEIVVIRPLVYLRESELERVARQRGYPKLPDCPWAKDNRREQIKYVLKYLKANNPKVDVVKNAFLSLMNVNQEYLPKMVRGGDEE